MTEISFCEAGTHDWYTTIVKKVGGNLKEEYMMLGRCKKCPSSYVNYPSQEEILP